MPDYDPTVTFCLFFGLPRPVYLDAEDCLYWWQLPFRDFLLDRFWV